MKTVAGLGSAGSVDRFTLFVVEFHLEGLVHSLIQRRTEGLTAQLSTHDMQPPIL